MARDDVASDETLLRRALEDDDQEAFATLVKRHEDRIFALAMKMTGDRSDALDATQEAFLAAYRRGRSFRGESSFGTWLYRIAINACKDTLRRRTRDPLPADDAFTDPGGADPARSHARTGIVEDAVATRLDIAKALALLPDEYRVAVVMHDLGGIPYEEIAHLTRTAVGTTKSRISRGRRKLAALLEHPAGARASKERDD